MRPLVYILFLTALFLCAPIASATLLYDDTTITNSADSDDHVPEIKLHPGAIEIKVLTPIKYHFHIYSITGQLIKSIEIADETQTVELKQGCYIIKCEKWSKKVVIK